MPLQKDLSYDDMALKEYKFSYEEKMIAKVRKLSSTLSTSNSGVTKRECLPAIFIHFQPQRSMLGEREISTCRCFLISLRLDFFSLLNDTSMHLVSEYMRILYLATVASRLFILIVNGNQRQSNRFG